MHCDTNAISRHSGSSPIGAASFLLLNFRWRHAHIMCNFPWISHPTLKRHPPTHILLHFQTQQLQRPKGHWSPTRSVHPHPISLPPTHNHVESRYVTTRTTNRQQEIREEEERSKELTLETAFNSDEVRTGTSALMMSNNAYSTALQDRASAAAIYDWQHRHEK